MDISFKQYAHHRQHHIPEADKIVPIITSAAAGMNRKQIGHAINIDRDSLDEILNGLIEIGWIRVMW